MSYSILHDEGGGATDLIATEVEPDVVNDNPTLREFEIDLEEYSGDALRFQVVATNAEASITSGIGRFVVATVPSKPPSIVQFQYFETPYVN